MSDDLDKMAYMFQAFCVETGLNVNEIDATRFLKQAITDGCENWRLRRMPTMLPIERQVSLQRFREAMEKLMNNKNWSIFSEA